MFNLCSHQCDNIAVKWSIVNLIGLSKILYKIKIHIYIHLVALYHIYLHGSVSYHKIVMHETDSMFKYAN